MGKRRYSKGDDIYDLSAKIIVGIIVLFVIYAGSQYTTNRGHFWQIIIYMILFAVASIGLVVGYGVLKDKMKQKKLDNLILQINKAGLDEYINNFISRFGLGKAKKGNWNYRGYNFDWERLKDLRKILHEGGVKVSLSDYKDIDSLLYNYIEDKEEAVTRESIKMIPQKFSNLSGTDFENLLYRLYEKMGYMVERTGRTGDQGGDLILNKGAERILVQAKRYSDDGSVGNAAVQQAVAAKIHYNCNRAVVVTTANFTREAFELAKTTKADLIPKKRVQELLLKYLNESWS